MVRKNVTSECWHLPVPLKRHFLISDMHTNADMHTYSICCTWPRLKSDQTPYTKVQRETPSPHIYSHTIERGSPVYCTLIRWSGGGKWRCWGSQAMMAKLPFHGGWYRSLTSNSSYLTHLISGILYKLGQRHCKASGTIHNLAIKTLLWLSQRGEWNLRKTKYCALWWVHGESHTKGEMCYWCEWVLML